MNTRSWVIAALIMCGLEIECKPHKPPWFAFIAIAITTVRHQLSKPGGHIMAEASRRKAAEELIKATDAQRELIKVGRNTNTDNQRVKDATVAYSEASSK